MPLHRAGRAGLRQSIYARAQGDRQLLAPLPSLGSLGASKLGARTLAVVEVGTYRDWGFAVFKLKRGAKRVHPMAFSLPRRDRGRLYFPTLHIHHRSVEKTARFDHALYCQVWRLELTGTFENADTWLGRGGSIPALAMPA